MSETTDDGGALGRVRTYWRRALFGPPAAARIEIYEELAPTVSAGIGLREALRSTADRHRGTKRQAVELLADGLDRDVTPSVTMRANPFFFTPLEAALVATGEQTGRLDVAFRAAAAQLERAQATRNKMLQAVSYPLVLVHCFILMCSFVRFAAGGSFLLLALPSFAFVWGGIFLAVSVHAARSGDVGYARLLRRIPVLGRTLAVGSLSRFASVFAALHGAGIPYSDALTLAGEASGDAVIHAEAQAAAAALARGATFAEALPLVRSIPSDDLGLLLAGEHSGELEGAAARVSILEGARHELAVTRMAAILRNGLVIVMGIAVGAYAISFYAKLYEPLLNMK